MSNLHINVVEAKPIHIGLMLNKMNTSIVNSALRKGINPKKALWYSYRESMFKKTAFINGEIAAMWGVANNLFSDVGYPWLVMTPEVEEYPMRVAFAYRRELKKMQEMYPILEDFVDEDNNKAIRLLELMGFNINKNKIACKGGYVLRATRKM